MSVCKESQARFREHVHRYLLHSPGRIWSHQPKSAQSRACTCSFRIRTSRVGGGRAPGTRLALDRHTWTVCRSPPAMTPPACMASMCSATTIQSALLLVDPEGQERQKSETHRIVSVHGFRVVVCWAVCATAVPHGVLVFARKTRCALGDISLSRRACVADAVRGCTTLLWRTGMR